MTPQLFIYFMLNNILLSPVKKDQQSLALKPQAIGKGSNSIPSLFSSALEQYNFNKNKNLSLNFAKDNATILLKYYFASISCLIGKPVFIVSPKKVTIHIYFYNPKKSTPSGELELTASNFKYLGYMLSQIFNKEVILHVTSLRYPYHDSNILAQIIGLNSHKYNFNKMLTILFNKAHILSQSKNNSPMKAGETGNTYSPLAGGGKDLAQLTNLHRRSTGPGEGDSILGGSTGPVSQLTGIKIKIAGRLASQRIVPKSTVKTAYKGSLSSTNRTIDNGKIKKTVVDTAKYTSKNKIGAYTVTVTLGHQITI
jgi:hypothetical protein